MHEVAFLSGRAKGGQAGSLSGLAYVGEIKMSGTVALSRSFKRIFPDLMTGVGLQRALAAVRVLVFATLKAVVHEKNHSILEGGGQFLYQRKEIEAHLSGIAFR